MGASAAVFGLLGALMAYFVVNPRLTRRFSQLAFLAFLVGGNLALGARYSGENLIDNIGHMGGFGAGLFLGLGGAPRFVLTEDGKEPINQTSPLAQVTPLTPSTLTLTP